jgi:hypothetical protein
MSSATQYQKSKPIVLKCADWKPQSVKYMVPKVNEKGGKSISVISTQSNRSLYISTPLMMTWGISDYVDEKTGEADGKYSISLNFPSNDYKQKSTTEFLEKLQEFENQILDDAVKNSELWWGEQMSREICKHTFFPVLKYPKNKDTKKTDYTRAPSIRAKVPCYEGKWGVELYDTLQNVIFPCEDPGQTPIDFVPKQSNIACVLQCGGIWIGGKGWGLTWKMVQGVVKPRIVESVYGKCHIELDKEEVEKLESEPLNVDQEDEETVQEPAVQSTNVPDSDDEEKVVEVEQVVPVKKTIKKPASVSVLETPTPTPTPEPAPEAPKKKIVKKKV